MPATGWTVLKITVLCSLRHVGHVLVYSIFKQNKCLLISLLQAADELLLHLAQGAQCGASQHGTSGQADTGKGDPQAKPQGALKGVSMETQKEFSAFPACGVTLDLCESLALSPSWFCEKQNSRTKGKGGQSLCRTRFVLRFTSKMQERSLVLPRQPRPAATRIGAPARGHAKAARPPSTIKPAEGVSSRIILRVILVSDKLLQWVTSDLAMQRVCSPQKLAWELNPVQTIPSRSSRWLQRMFAIPNWMEFRDARINLAVRTLCVCVRVTSSLCLCAHMFG